MRPMCICAIYGSLQLVLNLIGTEGAPTEVSSNNSLHWAYAGGGDQEAAASARHKTTLVQWDDDDDDNNNELHDTVGTTFVVSFRDALEGATRAPYEYIKNQHQQQQQQQQVADKKWGKLIFHGRSNPSEGLDLVAGTEGVQVKKIGSGAGSAPWQLPQRDQHQRQVKEEEEEEGARNELLPIKPLKHRLSAAASPPPVDSGAEPYNSWRPIPASRQARHFRSGAARSMSWGLVDKTPEGTIERPTKVVTDNYDDDDDNDEDNVVAVGASGSFVPAGESSWKPITGRRVNRWRSSTTRRPEEAGAARRRTDAVERTNNSRTLLALAELPELDGPPAMYHLSSLEQPFDDDGIVVLKHSLSVSQDPEVVHQASLPRPRLPANATTSTNWAPVATAAGNHSASSPPPPPVNETSDRKSVGSLLQSAGQPHNNVSSASRSRSRQQHLAPSFKEQLLRVYGGGSGGGNNNKIESAIEPDYWSTETSGSVTLPRPPPILEPNGNNNNNNRAEDDDDRESLQVSISRPPLFANYAAQIDPPEEEYYYHYVDHYIVADQPNSRADNPKFQTNTLATMSNSSVGQYHRERPPRPPISAPDHLLQSTSLSGRTSPMRPMRRPPPHQLEAPTTFGDEPTAKASGVEREIHGQPDSYVIRPLGKLTRQTTGGSSYLLRPVGHKTPTTATYVTDLWRQIFPTLQ